MIIVAGVGLVDFVRVTDKKLPDWKIVFEFELCGRSSRMWLIYCVG